jgi:hypothetical protein
MEDFEGDDAYDVDGKRKVEVDTDKKLRIGYKVGYTISYK